MVIAAFGGIIAITITFVFFLIMGDGFRGYSEGLVDIFDVLGTSGGGAYVYLYALPVFGILTVVLAAVAYFMQKKEIAYAVPLMGVLVLVVPLLFLFQYSGDNPYSLIDVLYTSTIVYPTGNSVMWFFIGGLFSWIGFGLIMLGSNFLINGINPAYIPAGPKREEAIKEKEMAHPDYVDKEQVERLRQERIAAREHEEEEKRQKKEEREYSTTCWVEIEAPASIAMDSTEEITASIINSSEVLVKSIEFDLADLEHYFTITGSLKFNNVSPGEELTGTIKIKPRTEEEGIFPILIEIKLDDEVIERRFSIRIESKDSY
jgi:hypothetical protein